jgi:hypothetical protein
VTNLKMDVEVEIFMVRSSFVRLGLVHVRVLC